MTDPHFNCRLYVFLNVDKVCPGFTFCQDSGVMFLFPCFTLASSWFNQLSWVSIPFTYLSPPLTHTLQKWECFSFCSSMCAVGFCVTTISFSKQFVTSIALIAEACNIRTYKWTNVSSSAPASMYILPKSVNYWNFFLSILWWTVKIYVSMLI